MFELGRLIEGVAPETRALLRSRRSSRRFARDEDLLRIEEQTPGAYLIAHGRVRSWRPLSDGRAVTLAILGGGSVTGLVACARGSLSPTIVTATEPVEADLWPTALIRRLLADDGVFARNCFALLVD